MTDNDTSLEIHSINRGSLEVTLIILSTSILGVIAYASRTIVKEFLRALTVKEKFIEIKRLSGEADAVHIDNLEKVLRLEDKDIAEKVANAIVAKYFVGEESDKHETTSFVKKSVDFILPIIKNGGSVSPKFLDPSPDEVKLQSELSAFQRELPIQQAKVVSLATGKEIKLVEDSNDNAN